jgi:O6-methylguanine-DNA--protein-cysteine methyltransferase
MIDISISDLDKENEISYREIDLKLERLTTYIKRAMTRSKKIKTLSSTAQNKASVQKINRYANKNNPSTKSIKVNR